MHAILKRSLIAVVLTAIGVGGFVVIKNRSEPAPKQAKEPVQSVKTILAERKAIPITVTANGYVTAINTVDVRPQIQNVVRTVHVREGQDVQAGQLLFTLDERSDNSNVDKAKAQVARDRADLADAEQILKRNEELLARKFVSQAVVDSARNKVDSQRSALKADQAATQNSQFALGYNQIRAGISGRIGTISVHPGSLAQPTGTAMLTIAQLDPISVSFTVPERELGAIVSAYHAGSVPVTAQLNDQTLKGKLIFIDNTTDSQSGTIRLKAQFDNSARNLWPGAYVNISMAPRTLPDAVVIPAQAIVTGPTNQFIYVVQPDDTVKMQTVQITAMEQGQAAVSGVTAGARVVVEGNQNLRPGSKVKEMADKQKNKSSAS